MEPPSSTYAEAIRDEQAKVLRTIRPLSCGERHARSVPRLSRPAGVAHRLAGGHLRGAAPRRGLLAVGGRSVLCPRRQVSDDDGHGSVRRAQAAAAGGIRRSRSRRSATIVRFRLSPQVAIAIGARAKRPGEGMTGRAGRTIGRRAAGRSSPGRLRASARRRDRRRRHALCAAGRRRSRLGHRRSAVWPIRARCSSTSLGSWGPSQAERLVAEIGGWNTPQ